VQITHPDLMNPSFYGSIRFNVPDNQSHNSEFVMAQAEGAITSGDLGAFEQQRAFLTAIAYRLLGTVSDAEDAVQEAFIRWQTTTTKEIKSPRAFLVTIVTRICLNQLKSARVKRESYVGQWLPEPIFTEDSSLAARESLSFAFLLLLERLTPVERAVLILREVFGLEYSQVGKIINKSEGNCRQILRRARKFLGENRSRFEVTSRERDELLKQFLAATSTGDLENLIALLSENVSFYSDGGGKGQAIPNVVIGKQNVARLIVGALSKLVPQDRVRRMTEVNGAPAIVSYLEGRVQSIVILDCADSRVQSIFVVTNPDKLRHIPQMSVLPS
jgi:RNA polymerase sigma-70 factor, ECF subfamily